MEPNEIYVYTAADDADPLHGHSFRLTRQVELPLGPGAAPVKVWQSVDVDTDEKHHWTDAAFDTVLRKV